MERAAEMAEALSHHLEKVARTQSTQVASTNISLIHDWGMLNRTRGVILMPYISPLLILLARCHIFIARRTLDKL